MVGSRVPTIIGLCAVGLHLLLALQVLGVDVYSELYVDQVLLLASELSWWGHVCPQSHGYVPFSFVCSCLWKSLMPMSIQSLT